MSEPVWVPFRAVQIIHDCQIARHAGASGFRDKGLLQNAVKGPVKNGSTKMPVCLNVPQVMPSRLLRSMHLLIEIDQQLSLQVSPSFV